LVSAKIAHEEYLFERKPKAVLREKPVGRISLRCKRGGLEDSIKSLFLIKSFDISHFRTFLAIMKEKIQG
jgi:hypothetical protein